MKAIRRNFLLAIFISTFAMFGALSSTGNPPKSYLKLSAQERGVKETQRTESTFICFGVAFATWVLCFWRCGVINRRLKAERLYQQRFLESMRSNAFQRQYH